MEGRTTKQLLTHHRADVAPLYSMTALAQPTSLFVMYVVIGVHHLQGR